MALWRGRPLLGHAIAALAPWCETVAVIGRDWPGHPRIDDRPQPGLGPLGGIAGALEWAGDNGFDSVLTIACDMPEVPEELLERLILDVPAYCPDAPVIGHWPANLAGRLSAHLHAVAPAEAGAAGGGALTSRHELTGPGLRRGDGKLSVRRWAEQIGAAPIPAPAPLRNINLATDL